MFDSLKAKWSEFSFGIAARKGAEIVAKAGVAYLVARTPQLQALSSQAGVSFSIDPETAHAAIAGGLLWLLGAGRNALKHFLVKPAATGV